MVDGDWPQALEALKKMGKTAVRKELRKQKRVRPTEGESIIGPKDPPHPPVKHMATAGGIASIRKGPNSGPAPEIRMTSIMPTVNPAGKPVVRMESEENTKLKTQVATLEETVSVLRAETESMKMQSERAEKEAAAVRLQLESIQGIGIPESGNPTFSALLTRVLSLEGSMTALRSAQDPIIKRSDLKPWEGKVRLLEEEIARKIPERMSNITTVSEQHAERLNIFFFFFQKLEMNYDYRQEQAK